MIVERMAKWLSHFRSSEPVSSCPSCSNFLDRPLKVSRTSRQTGCPNIGEFNLKQFGAVTKLWQKVGSFEIILTFAECVKTAKNEFWTIWVKIVRQKKNIRHWRKKQPRELFCFLDFNMHPWRIRFADLHTCPYLRIIGEGRGMGWKLSHHITFQIDSFNETHGIIWKK